MAAIRRVGKLAAPSIASIACCWASSVDSSHAMPAPKPSFPEGYKPPKVWAPKEMGGKVCVCAGRGVACTQMSHTHEKLLLVHELEGRGMYANGPGGCVCVCVCACVFVCLFACLFVCLSACLFVCLFVCLCACLLVCLFQH